MIIVWMTVMMRMMKMTGRRRVMIVLMIIVTMISALSLYIFLFHYHYTTTITLTYLPLGSIEQEKIDKHRRRMRHFNRDKNNLGTIICRDDCAY